MKIIQKIPGCLLLLAMICVLSSCASKHVPEAMYSAEIQSYIDDWTYSDKRTDINYDYNVNYIPNKSQHQETVQVDYHFYNDCAYWHSSKSYIYQYYASDDIWERIDTQSNGHTFDLYWNTFPRHWEETGKNMTYSIDILGFDMSAQTITISYDIDGSLYGTDYHQAGTQTINYRFEDSRYSAEFVDKYSFIIYMDLNGLACYRK